MEILKDVLVIVIYGINGVNGVILIIIKCGIFGKLIICYNGYFGVEDFFYKLDFCDGV